MQVEAFAATDDQAVQRRGNMLLVLHWSPRLACAEPHLWSGRQTRRGFNFKKRSSLNYSAPAFIGCETALITSV
jgi:hypothetical protein